MSVNMSIIGANASERDQNEDSLFNASTGVKSSKFGDELGRWFNSRWDPQFFFSLFSCFSSFSRHSLCSYTCLSQGY